MTRTIAPLKVLVPPQASAASDRARWYAAALVNRVNGELVYGTPDEDVRTAAERHRPHLIALADTPPEGLIGWPRGSLAEQLLREMKTPVLLIPEACQAPWLESGAAGRVLVPLDGSRFAEEALAPASELARLLGAGLLLLQVVEPINPGWYGESVTFFSLASSFEALQADAEDYLSEMAQSLEKQGRDVDVLSAFGRPAAKIAATARSAGASAIVMATHGRSGLTRLVLGSVASSVARQATMPVVLLPPGHAGLGVFEPAASLAVPVS